MLYQLYAILCELAGWRGSPSTGCVLTRPADGLLLQGTKCCVSRVCCLTPCAVPGPTQLPPPWLSSHGSVIAHFYPVACGLFVHKYFAWNWATTVVMPCALVLLTPTCVVCIRVGRQPPHQTRVMRSLPSSTVGQPKWWPQRVQRPLV